jgi:acyl-CoA thioester hydrolase
MSNWRETYRGVVSPWECDLNEHLTVRQFLPKFDDASYFLLTELGVYDTELRSRSMSIVAVSHKLRYLEELRIGALIIIKSAVVRVGNSSVGHNHKMFNGESGRLAAVCRGIDVLFDLAERRSTPWPDDLRAGLEAAIVEFDQADAALFDG